jgi:hypothetical protein
MQLSIAVVQSWPQLPSLRPEARDWGVIRPFTRTHRSFVTAMLAGHKQAACGRIAAEVVGRVYHVEFI